MTTLEIAFIDCHHNPASVRASKTTTAKVCRIIHLPIIHVKTLCENSAFFRILMRNDACVVSCCKINLTDIECAKTEHEIICAFHIMQGLTDIIPPDHDNVLKLLDYFMYDNINAVKDRKSVV